MAGRSAVSSKFILAHDLGTTGNKASLYDASGRVHASVFYGYGTQYPRPNWVEQDPEDWWRAVCVTTQQLLSSARLKSDDVAVVSFSGQMMGCVPVDEQVRPLRSSIIWADTRAVEQAQRWLDTLGMEATYRITGHRASSSYSGEKILWIRDYQPEIYSQTYKFLHAKDFIVARLTGRFVTDVTDASGMNLFDIQNRDWSPAILDAIHLGPACLPELHASTDVVGEVTRGAAAAVGLTPGTPVVIGAGDGMCAAVGAGVVRDGSAFNYIGSSSWIATSSSKPLYDPTMRTVVWVHMIPGMYSPNGTMQAAGGSYQWVREVLCLPEKEAAVQLKVSPYELMNLQAEQSEPGANGLLFFPYLLGERSPRWNPNARGVFFGLTMSHTRADLIRATLEGITLNLRVILEILQNQGANITAMRVIGGGAQGRVWRQIMADIYGMPIQRPALLAEATSLGAAVAGGIGVGIFKDFNVAEELTPIQDVVYPNSANRPIYEKLYTIFNRAYDAFVPLYEELAADERRENIPTQEKHHE